MAIIIRTMTGRDVPLGMALTDRAGWNQTEADWLRFLALEPEGCFVAEWDGRPVGTTVTTVLGAVGWIAMVLVDEVVRGQGFGTRLVEHAVTYLRQRARSPPCDWTPRRWAGRCMRSSASSRSTRWRGGRAPCPGQEPPTRTRRGILESNRSRPISLPRWRRWISTSPARTASG